MNDEVVDISVPIESDLYTTKDQYKQNDEQDICHEYDRETLLNKSHEDKELDEMDHQNEIEKDFTVNRNEILSDDTKHESELDGDKDMAPSFNTAEGMQMSITEFSRSNNLMNDSMLTHTSKGKVFDLGFSVHLKEECEEKCSK